MKKETLEEAAEKLYREYPNNPLDKPEWHYNRDVDCFKKRKAFIAGASWQQERILQFLYSEITERRPYSSSRMCEEVIKFIEQFKNKQ